LPADPKEPAGKVRYFANVKDSKPVDCLIRVYIIRGIELQPKDPNGKADPYIVVELGKKKITDKDNYIPNEINPFFGAYYELKARIPLEKDLKIKIMDYDFLSRNDLIGETVIDLENRYYSSARATVGLPPAYYTWEILMLLTLFVSFKKLSQISKKLKNKVWKNIPCSNSINVTFLLS